ncbi:unnamed protein product [Cladocopium goreaui]|uniref:Nephrocystin-3 n=1 Tax=Cladocopium goreaui TaxID=2562237 RepID=A0A9P1DHL8_9DINO|nr:unnamed protein product [Cladocopium goreaui]
MKRSLYGDRDHPGIAATLHALGTVSRAAGDLSEATLHLEESLRMKRSLYGDRDHPGIAATLHELGQVSRAAGDLPEAKQHLEESLRMERSLHGDRDHLEIAATLHELGQVSRAAGDLPAAKQNLEESLRMERSLYGDRDHPDIAVTLHALGQVSRSLRMKRSLYGDRAHPDIAETLHALGQVSEAAGDLPEALPYYLVLLRMSRALSRELFELVTEAAGYVKAGDAVVPKHVVTGSGHAEPNFFNASVGQLHALTEWIERRADGVAPWVARVHLNGPNLPKGSWEVLSSEAFLTVPLQWYVLLSAGTLRPKVSEVHLHPMGMNAWPQKPESNATKRKKKALVDDTLMREFNMLKPFVEKPTAAGATLAWVPHEGRPIVFTKATNKWSHAELSYTQVNILMLLIAVTFNIVVSVLVAAYVINWLQTNADFQQELKEAAVTIASSHRIGKLSGKVNSSWRIIAAHVEQPDQGVILRWRKRTGVQSSAYLCVKAKADPDPARGLDGDEICINMAVQERVDMKAESNIIIEFFFSASGSKGYPPEGGYEPTGKDLKCQYSYRFQVEGYNNNEELVAVSDWSNEVYIKPRSSVFDVPSRILQVNCAVPTDSLEFFVEHFAQFNIEGKHPQHLVILSDIKVCYHKNWRDFRDFSSDFLLTAWMGETSARCERETRAGTCRSFDKTGIFRPPDDVVQGDVDDEEDKRTQELNEVVPGRPTLCVGGADRKLCDLFVTLRKSSGEDVAEGTNQNGDRWRSMASLGIDLTVDVEAPASTMDDIPSSSAFPLRYSKLYASIEFFPRKLEWDDLIEAFDKYEQSNDISEDQSIFVELATDKVEGEFDEEWLVWVEARVTFKNELDPKCVEMPYHKRIFQLDPPGQIFYEGMERFMAWDASSLAQSQHGDEAGLLVVLVRSRTV